MRVADFHFDLPPELIAQHPPSRRGSSRMLRLDRTTGTLTDDRFRSFPHLLRPGDLLILNDSRVLPARLFATRAGLRTQASSPDPSGRIEVLLTENLLPDQPEAAPEWRALVRPARKVQPGETLLFFHPSAPEHPLLTAQVVSAGDRGERTLRFTLAAASALAFLETVESIGHMPLPPYIRRDQAAAADSQEDRARYQTVYAAASGSDQQRSAAAPTAGLHFTPEILAELESRGVEVRYLTLHVGLGTFQPVRVEDLAEIRLHAEHYTLPPAAAEALNRARRDNRRIVAAGTTTTRTLEHVALQAERLGQTDLHPHSGSTSIFLSPGHRFRLVRGLLTNFHLPESTLLMLVSGFLAPPDDPDQGRAMALHAYTHAVRERYRFFSYGDCMLIL